MADMKDTLMGLSLGDLLSIQGSGSASPMHEVGEDGVRQGGYNINGRAEASVPIDPLIRDAMLRLSAGGYAYGGKVELPQKFQDFGAPAEIKYGDKVTDHLGIGLTRGDMSADLGYNPASNNYSLGYLDGGFSGDLGYNPQTGDKSIYAKYKWDF